MSPSFRALVFLPCIIICIYALIISEIDILVILILLLLSWLLLLMVLWLKIIIFIIILSFKANIILVLIIVRELAEIILVLVICLGVHVLIQEGALHIFGSWVMGLFGMDPSLVCLHQFKYYI